MKGIEYRIGLRYTRSPKRNHFISFVSLFSVIGIAIGIAVIITVLSVMNGFREEIRDKILNFTAHGLVSNPQSNVDNWRDIEGILRENKRIVGYSPYFELQGILKTGQSVEGAFVRGINPDSEKKVSELEQYLSDASTHSFGNPPANILAQLTPGSWNIILGASLARRLGVRPGDRLVLLSSQILHTPLGALPRMRRLTVAGILQTGMSQYDRHIALMNIRDTQLIAQAGERVTGVQLRYDDLFMAQQIGDELQQRLPIGYWVSSWTDRNQNFFKALEMEKLLLLIIMTLIVAVAAFNIVSSLIMLVIEKKGDIAILKTMGMKTSGIIKIFMTQGCLIGFLGSLAGIIGGVVLASNLERLVATIEELSGYKFLSPEVYPVTEVPAQLLWGDVVTTAVIAFLLTVVATLYPAIHASKIQPSEALRYE